MTETHFIQNEVLREKLQLLGIVFGLAVLIIGIISILVRVI